VCVAAVVFSQGKPFRPFEQLLSVLPASSAPHLPEPFRWLMSDPASPILDFYPTDFPVDMEGKRADWEGIAKICFVDEERLLAAARSVRPQALTAEERQRNEPGPILVFAVSRSGSSDETEFCTSTLPHRWAGPRWRGHVHSQEAVGMLMGPRSVLMPLGSTLWLCLHHALPAPLFHHCGPAGPTQAALVQHTYTPVHAGLWVTVCVVSLFRGVHSHG
jgi:hypothetical protein